MKERHLERITTQVPARAAPPPQTRAVPPRPACGQCRHASQGGAALEQGIAGLSTMGSGFGSSVGASRLCGVHDCLVGEHDYCARFAVAAR
jgi:hypothetical protein